MERGRVRPAKLDRQSHFACCAANENAALKGVTVPPCSDSRMLDDIRLQDCRSGARGCQRDLRCSCCSPLCLRPTASCRDPWTTNDCAERIDAAMNIAVAIRP